MPFETLSYCHLVGDVGLIRLCLEDGTGRLQLIITTDLHWEPNNDAMKHAALQMMTTLHDQPGAIHPALRLVPERSIIGRYYVCHIMRGNAPWHAEAISLRTMPIFDGIVKAAAVWLEHQASQLQRLTLQPG